MVKLTTGAIAFSSSSLARNTFLNSTQGTWHGAKPLSIVLIVRHLPDSIFVAVEFATVWPVVSCGAFYPDFDFLGQRLQSLSSKAALEAIAVNLTVLNGRSVIILGWLGSGGPAEAFASSYLRLPEAELANAAVRHALEYGENTYIRPTWWSSLPEGDRDCVIASIYTMDASTVSQREATGLCRDGRVFASAAVTRVVW